MEANLLGILELPEGFIHMHSGKSQTNFMMHSRLRNTISPFFFETISYYISIQTLVLEAKENKF